MSSGVDGDDQFDASAFSLSGVPFTSAANLVEALAHVEQSIAGSGPGWVGAA